MFTFPPALTTPNLVQIFNLVRNPIAFFDHHLATQGNVFTAGVLGSNNPKVVFIGEPSKVEEIFTAPLNTFALGKVTHVFRPLTGNRSLIMLDGKEHLRQRKLMMPPLHGDRMKTYTEEIIEITRKNLARFPNKEEFSLRPYLADITLEIILQVVFGIKEGERYQALQHLIGELLEEITQPLYSTCFFFEFLQQDLGKWSPWGRFIRRQKKIDDLIYAEIEERRHCQNFSDRTDILSLLLTATDEKGQGLTNQELRDQLITLLLLGHETTASSLAWAIYWVLSQPEVKQKLQQELSTQSNLQIINKNDYLEAVCNETLRLYPIALISQPRITIDEYQLGEYLLPPQTVVIPSIYLAHRNPEVYPQPLEFRPERFLERKFSPYEFFPFGGGHRGCIGMAFSLFEMRLILQTMFSFCDLELTPQTVKPVRRGITIVPSSNIKVKTIN